MHKANQDFADSVFAMGTTTHGIAAQATNFYRNYINNFINNATVPLLGAVSGSTAWNVSDNPRLSLRPMPYQGSLTYAGSFPNRKITRMTHSNDDNVRTTFAYMTAKNRFGILYEVPNSPTVFARAHAHYASTVSTVDQAGKQKNEMLAFFNRKDAEMKNRVDTSGVNLYIGAITASLTSANAGVASIYALTPYDLGDGPGLFNYDAFPVGNTANPTSSTYYDRTVNEIHTGAEIWNVNTPQNPTQMGAFYIIDARADKIATGLLRHGIKLSKLTRDVTLPASQTVKFFYSGQAQGNWTVRRHTAFYEGHYATRIESGDWNPLPGGGDIVAKQGSYVFSSAQPHGRFASYWVEPKAACGAFLWNFADDQLIRGGTTWTQASFDIVKTFSYAAIPDSALHPLSLEEDENDEPEYTFAPPYLNLNGNFSSLTDAGATILSAVQNGTNGEVKLTIQDACLYDRMWLTFFFYDEGGKRVDVLQQVFESATPGTYEALFPYSKLINAGLAVENRYIIHYSNEWGDIFGYGTSSKGWLSFKKYVEPEPEPEPCFNGCNMSYAAIALLAFIPFFVIKRKK
jgi:hypothetical protein